MKEINILCVEDGSVDVERLEQEGLHDGKVIIYRQGANPPFVLKLKTDDGEFKSEQNKVAVEKLEELEKAIRGKLIIRTTGYDDNAEDDGYNKCVLEMVQLVREQIKELKGESDE